jgi:hypothetical protein
VEHPLQGTSCAGRWHRVYAKFQRCAGMQGVGQHRLRFLSQVIRALQGRSSAGVRGCRLRHNALLGVPLLEVRHSSPPRSPAHAAPVPDCVSSSVICSTQMQRHLTAAIAFVTLLAELARDDVVQRTCAASAAGGRKGPATSVHAVAGRVLGDAGWRVGDSWTCRAHGSQVCPMPGSALLSACSRQSWPVRACAEAPIRGAPGGDAEALRACAARAQRCSVHVLAVCGLCPQRTARRAAQL